jgi:sensor histidine kinase YesM
MLVMANFKNVKKGLFISNFYWISIFFIPLGTLVMCILLLLYIDINSTHILTSIAILLFINFTTFYLYDELTKSYAEKFENLLIKEQNNSYQRQLHLMENSIKKVSSIRHDIKNHLTALSTYINNDEKEKALSYIAQIMDFSYGKKEYACSENLDIDSILNYKLLEAESKGITTSLELKIPAELKFSSFDMVAVLCNLLDNSIIASSKLTCNKKINASIVYKKSILFIHIENTFDGNVIYDNGKIITTNKDKENHGIGLSNIKNVIDKYNGTMVINHTSNNFIVDIMMYTKRTEEVLV